MIKKLAIVLSCCMILFTSFLVPVNAIVTDDGVFGYINGKEYPIIDLTGPTFFTEHTLPNGFLYTPYFNGNEFNTYFNATSGTHTIHIDLETPESFKEGSLLNISLSGTSSGITSINSTVNVQFYYQDTTSSYSTFTLEKNGGNWNTQGSCVELDGAISSIFIDFTINTGTTGCLFEITDINISETSTGGMFNDILNNISDIPNKVVDSISGFFDLEDDSVVSDNENSNNNLQNNLDQYDDVENTIVDNFNTNIGNLDTSLNLFDSNDFQMTSLFVSQQLTNVFNLNENIRNVVMYSLIMGFAFVLIGIGLKR